MIYPQLLQDDARAAGISTLVTRFTAENRSTLAEHISAYDPTTVARLQQLTRAMMARGADLWTAQKRAIALLDRQVTGQASVIAYGEIYLLSAVIILLLIPLLLLIRQTRGAGGAHAVME